MTFSCLLHTYTLPKRRLSYILNVTNGERVVLVKKKITNAERKTSIYVQSVHLLLKLFLLISNLSLVNIYTEENKGLHQNMHEIK